MLITCKTVIIYFRSLYFVPMSRRVDLKNKIKTIPQTCGKITSEL